MSVTRANKLKLQKLTATVGAEVQNVRMDSLLNDEELSQAIMAALNENGVLVFRQLDIDDDGQLAFGTGLGGVGLKITEISANPENPIADALHGTIEWHMDGTTRGLIPDRATILSAKVIAPTGGETEFASSYAAYELLSDEEKEGYAELRVIHSFAQSQRSTHPSPTPEQLADWESRGSYEYPLVWSHRSGRRSLVIGSSAEYVLGMDPEDSRALLDDLLQRATSPTRVYRHHWSVGDMVIWDNPGILHRVLAFDWRSGREMHRTSIAGDEQVR